MTYCDAIHDSGSLECVPNPHYSDSVAWELYRTRRYHDADRIIQQVVVSSFNPVFEYHAGLIAYALGRKDEAAQRVKQALVSNRGKAFPS